MTSCLVRLVKAQPIFPSTQPRQLRKGIRGLYNLGSGHANTWLTLAAAIFGALGSDPNVAFIDMPESLRAKYQYYTQADISKLRATSYDRPITPLADAVGDYVRNYLVPGRRLGE